MAHTSKSDSRFSSRNLILMTLVVVASLTYLAYYSNVALRTHKANNGETHVKLDGEPGSEEYLSDEDYLAYVLRKEQASKSDRAHKRQTFSQSSDQQVDAEPLYDQYVAELEASLAQIPLDQPGLRQPIEERLKNARDE